jgi:predicted DNA binding CopG/RHH family protein
MRNEYDFSKAIRNPYAKRIKKQVTIRLDEITISYFKKLADEIGVPYQTLINLYLRDCAATGRKLSLNWRPAAKTIGQPAH